MFGYIELLNQGYMMQFFNLIYMFLLLAIFVCLTFCWMIELHIHFPKSSALNWDINLKTSHIFYNFLHVNIILEVDKILLFRTRTIKLQYTFTLIEYVRKSHHGAQYFLWNASYLKLYVSVYYAWMLVGLEYLYVSLFINMS